MNHGRFGYTYKHCRCLACWQAYMDWKAERLASGDYPHGDRRCYFYGCRCDICRVAESAHRMARKAAKKVTA